MYKLVVFTTLLALAAAAPGLIGAPGIIGAPGYIGASSLYGAPGLYGAHIGAPLASPWGHGLVGAPVIGAGVVKTALPVATSYANTVRLASPAVVAAPAPIYAGHGLVSPLAHGW